MSKTKTSKKRKASAGGRIKAQGKSLVWVTFGESDKQKIRTAAAFRGLPMSEFLKQTGLREAAIILEKIRSTA